MVQHLSIRVPWHDNNWNGTVCLHPERNQACRVLKGIAEKKEDSTECNHDVAGKAFHPVKSCITEKQYLPPCLRGSGTFMSDLAIDTLPIEHPYASYPGCYAHINKTPYIIDAHSFTAIPYAWMLRENADAFVKNHLRYTQYDDSIEIQVRENKKNTWVSNGINQRNIFNYFYSRVKSGDSMAVAYAKAVPFIETPGRVIIGIGTITSVEDLREYKYTRDLKKEDITAYIWERQIGHSIRENRENGFVFPFNAIQKYLNDNPDESPEELVVIAPDGYFAEFSYAAEHLSYDALILTLNKTIAVLRKYQEIGLPCGNGKNWAHCVTWCKEKLKTVWKDRGLYPGLGNVLQAAGLKYGQDIAAAMRDKFCDKELWSKLPNVLANIKDYLPKNVPKDVIRNIGKSTFEAQYVNNGDMLKLLSRINLTLDQARVALNPANTLAKAPYADSLSSIKHLTSDKFLNNPYLLYEQTRLLEEKYRFGIGQIDVATFPDPILDSEDLVVGADDMRRLRAIIVSILENAAQNGNTLLLADEIVKYVNSFRSDVDLQLEIAVLTVKAFGEFFSDEFVSTDAQLYEEKIPAYQLQRLVKIDAVIKTFVTSRLGDTSMPINDDWKKHLEAALKGKKPGPYESQSRSEKLKAIELMANAQISVLTGGAGTGKTSTIVGLCLSPAIQKGGIIVLAPTGKARVVLSAELHDKQVPHTADTVFRFLKQTKHCDWKTYRYYLSDIHAEVAGATVIIDECSMLTEEMMAALAEALKKAKRVIFVGDPNQLPPIGAGKPFFELVEYLRAPDNTPKDQTTDQEQELRRKRYATLLISNRQHPDDKVKPRLDVEFAKLFTYDKVKDVGEDIFSRIGSDSANIEFRQFTEAALREDETLEAVLLEAVKDAANMAGIDDILEFDKSLGGEPDSTSTYMNFPNVARIESWQILSPYRNNPACGTATINRVIHTIYRIQNYLGALKKRRTKHPLGNDRILYGEKVINLQNQEINGYPKNGCLNYVANGEIGIVQWVNEKPNMHNVCFTSQPQFTYGYLSRTTDNDADLELAYALTVHKAQGSGFGTTIFVVLEPPKGANAFITREMIYTALTRQNGKIIIMYNKEPAEFMKYAATSRSELAQRLTNLFGIPIVSMHEKRYYEDNLIHISRSGVRLRSKSEVIIANELDCAGVEFKYEKENPKTGKYLPDFTIPLSDANGDIIIWEHLGMLNDLEYREKWKQKQADYAQSGISEENGNLIITVDKPNGGIDGEDVKNRVEKLRMRLKFRQV